jgi:hypothetical protein
MSDSSIGSHHPKRLPKSPSQPREEGHTLKVAGKRCGKDQVQQVLIHHVLNLQLHRSAHGLQLHGILHSVVVTGVRV